MSPRVQSYIVSLFDYVIKTVSLFQHHTTCKGAAICDDIFVVAPLQEVLALVAELKLMLKQDLDLDLDVPKFKCYVPGNRVDNDQAREVQRHFSEPTVLFGSRLNGCGCVYKGTTCCRYAYRR